MLARTMLDVRDGAGLDAKGDGAERPHASVLCASTRAVKTAWLACFGLCALLFGGCPRELQPPPPGEATPCAEHRDCNGGRECGVLALCVGGYCEESPSFPVPCPGEGSPVITEPTD